MTKQPKFILASGSPRRKELLDQIGMQYTVEISDTDEGKIVSAGIPARTYVQELAMAKAANVAKKHRKEKDILIISADTVVVYNNKILGKPKDKVDAFHILYSLSGKQHDVYTGFCVMDPHTMEAVCSYASTKVQFKPLSKDQIVNYIHTGEPMDKAGAYGIQGIGALLIERIEGDYFNVVGLPVSKLADVLARDFNINILTGKRHA